MGFVMGKAKLAPLPEHTVPRLELCAAVLAVELAELISSEIDMELDDTIFYSDSKVVLVYISNDTRRFYVYVSNRVQRIRCYSRPEQWQYVSTDVNPADIATRSVTAAHLSSTSWFHGPAFLKHPQQAVPEESTFELLNPSLDTEIRPQVSTMKMSILQTIGVSALLQILQLELSDSCYRSPHSYFPSVQDMSTNQKQRLQRLAFLPHSDLGRGTLAG